MKIEHLRKASIVMGNELIRIYICGVMVDGRNTVATDGHRGVHCINEKGEEGSQIIIPRETVLNFLKATKGQTDYKIEDNCLVSGNISMSFEPIDGKYPDYKRAFLGYKYEGKLDEIAFNPKYLADIYKVFGKEPILFNFDSNSTPVKIHQKKECSMYLMACRD